MDLQAALTQLDKTEANLVKLEQVWASVAAAIPDGLYVGTGGSEDHEMKELIRQFDDLASALPGADGFRVESRPLTLDEIFQFRFDATELGEPGVWQTVEATIHEPGHDIGEYRHRFARLRRKVIRNRLGEVMTEVDALLASLTASVSADGNDVPEAELESLRTLIREIERLLGSSLVRRGRWADLHRHLSFGQGVDVHDIANLDWPTVRSDIQASMYAETEPIEVEVEDLTELAAATTGAVSTAAAWDAIGSDDFERVIFNLLHAGSGYTNVQWLTKTTASDRGRDISAYRAIEDPLSGSRTERVLVQCKHWTSRSIGPTDVSDALSTITLHEPPPVDVLVLATSGRFTDQGVAVIEKHNEDRKQPRLEVWANSHLEVLLARHPQAAVGLGLHP